MPGAAQSDEVRDRATLRWIPWSSFVDRRCSAVAIYLWGRRGNRAESRRTRRGLRGRRPSRRCRQRPQRRWCEPRRVESAAGRPAADDVDTCATSRCRSKTHAARRASTTVARPARADLCRRCRPRRCRSEPVAERGPRPAAPTLSSSDAPQPRRIERRKILALRLATRHSKFEGAKLLESLLAESLQHGKYGIFHRLHSDGSIVSASRAWSSPVPSISRRWRETLYPGITMFTQLPGPVPGMHAFNELVACARRLQANLGGTLQDERGVPLTVHRIERMRQEVREFERPPAGGGRGAGSHSAQL